MFINFTNHSSSNWSEVQISAAEKYGEIKDIPFPSVDPSDDGFYISNLADYYNSEIIKYKPTAVLCQGEMTLAFAVVTRLNLSGIVVLAACSSRVSKEITGIDGKTTKHSEFVFVQFRRYF